MKGEVKGVKQNRVARNKMYAQDERLERKKESRETKKEL